MGGYGEDQPVLRVFLCADQGQLPRAARERPTISSKRVIRSRKRKPRSVNRSNSVRQGCLEPQEEAL
jgi:hypothetical protein